MLKRAAGDTKEPIVVINADAQATHQSVVHVMEAARAAGHRAHHVRDAGIAERAAQVSATRGAADAQLVCAAGDARCRRRCGRCRGCSAPCAALRRAALSARRCCTRTRLPVPVVVVGNITVGGAGKTPLVVALADALARARLAPGHRQPRLRTPHATTRVAW